MKTLLERFRSIISSDKALSPRSETSQEQESDEAELGAWVLSELRKYGEARGGLTEGLDSQHFLETVHKQKGLYQLNRAQQHFQTALMPAFTDNLYDFYKAQEWLIFLNFLSYPFQGKGSLEHQFRPYADGLSGLESPAILDFGAGIPYGLLYAIRQGISKPKCITLVDLDLAHAPFAKHLVEAAAPWASVESILLRDANTIPTLPGDTFNLLYAKDVFEHVSDPETVLKALLPACSEHDAVAMLDLRDHGEVTLQHVSPDLARYNRVVEELGFSVSIRSDGMTEARRSANSQISR